MEDFPNLDNYERLAPRMVQDVQPVDEYRRSKRISNSDLDAVPYLLRGEQKPGINQYTLKAYLFGQALHSRILEPEKFNVTKFDGVNWLLLDKLVQAVEKSEAMKEYLRLSLKEVAHDFELLGLPCKCKIDMVYLGIEGILDIKTTSADSPEEFAKAVKKYNYDRQMAFYCDAVGGKRAILVGISKKTFELYFYALTDADFEAGRAKYTEALRIIKENNLMAKLFDSR